jgi:RING finger/CHY zinc finger protein 1
MGKYYCEICHVFDDIKDIFHCDKCGNCRLGKIKEMDHCNKCNCCFPKNKHDKTKCVQNIVDSVCPICMDSLYDSVDGFHMMKCGHLIHVKCLTMYIQTSDKCPLCCKTIIFSIEKYMQLRFLVATTPMPTEYLDKKVNIYCNDCGKTNEVPWNCIAQFCPDCNSYNVK